MLDKLSSAWQLGIAGLAKRGLWRCGMAVRIIIFQLVRRHIGWNTFAQESDLASQFRTPTFLADPEKLQASLLAEDAIASAEKARIFHHANLALRNLVEVRGYGRQTLRLEPADWYAYDDGVLMWMINRHDFLLPLCQAYLLTKDDKYAQKVRDLFEYWVSEFRLETMKAHDTPIDVGFRVLNWLWAMNLGVLRIDPQQEKEFSRIIYVQLEYIRVWSSGGGNHLLLEALASYIYGVVFRSTRAGRRWYSWGRRVLAREITRQVTLDGLHTEESTFYHQACTTHFLKAYRTAARHDSPMAMILQDRVRQMIGIVHDTMKPDLSHPLLGDGEPMVTDDREHWEAKVLIAAGAKLFGDPVFKPFTNTLNDSAIWFLGTPAKSIPQDDTPPDSKIYENSGLVLFRGNGRYLLIDAAPFGDPHFPHHGHSDALSVEICMNGRNLIVDPGGYGYYNDEYRRHFRSTSAHNTLQIDGKEQSETFGVLGYGRLAPVTLESWSQNNVIEKATGSHGGYKPVVHRREVYHHKAAHFFLIVDWLLGSGHHRVESFLHLAPGLKVDMKRRLFTDQRYQFPWAIAATDEIELSQLGSTETGQIQGWYTAATGNRIPINVLSARAETVLPFVLATAFFEDGQNGSLELNEETLVVKTDSDAVTFRLDRIAGFSAACD